MLILEILKIAGIILLGVLGILLLLILALLILPWRYRIRGTIRNREYEGNLEVIWLFGAVFLKQHFKSGAEAGGILRVFGLRLFRTGEIGTQDKKISEPEEKELSVPDRAESGSSLSKDPVQRALKQNTSENPSEDPAGNSFEEAAENPSENTSDNTAVRRSFTDQIDTEIRLLEKRTEELIRKAAEYSGKHISAVIRKGKSSFSKLVNDSRQRADKLRKLKEILFGKENRKDMKRLLSITRKALKQILPGEGSGKLVFGTGEPYYTGKILEILAFLFPFYGEIISVCPCFEETKLEADADVRGHVHLIVLLVCFARVWFNRRLREIYAELMKVLTYEQSE